MPKTIDVENIHRTAVRLFAHHGYQGTTTAEIAREAGVSELTLFRRFGTKAKLIESALRFCLAESPFAAITQTDDVRADLVGIVESFRATQEAYGDATFALVMELPRTPELREVAPVLMPNLVNAAQIIGHHQSRESLRAGSPLELLITLLAPVMLQGIWMRANIASPFAMNASELVERFLTGHVLDSA